MKKRNYRTKKVNQMNWDRIKEQIAGEACVFAIDVAKKQQYAMLSTADGCVSSLMSWNHPDETGAVVRALSGLGCRLTVVMESTGTYGDALRYQFTKHGMEVYQISAKRVSDAREVYDGVPSMHDAKAATVITCLHREGISRPWRESTDDERRMDALRREYDLHQSQYQRNQNRLEAYLSRHWPEVLYLLSLDSVTLEHLLIEYGAPEEIAQASSQAAKKMRGWGKSQMTAEKIACVLKSAATTLGQPCIEAEREYLQALATEMHHSRLQRKAAKHALEAIIGSDDELRELGITVGRVTTAVFMSCRLDPRHYGCARSYQKAFGLNLKEKSSGKHVGRLKITKRGSSTARRYLYFSALRLIKNNPVVKSWYENKVDPRAKNKTVIALMRKLAKAVWHLGRGERFDANKLLTITTT